MSEEMPAWARAMEERLVARLDARVAGAEERLTDLFRGELRGEAERLRAEAARERGAIMGRLEEITNALTEMREASVVDFGAAERSERVARGAEGYARALGDQVNALVRDVRRLQSQVRELRGGAP
jgi:hypothetical protein